MSPSLFNLFIDDLLTEIVSQDIGLRINGSNFSVMAYCDDIILISTSLIELQHLCKTCEKYGRLWNINFNPKKSCVFQTGAKLYRDNQLGVSISDQNISISNGTKYLGLEFQSSLNFSSFIEKKFKEVNKAFFSLYNYGMRPYGLNLFTKANIYLTYCLPKVLYGLGVVTLSDSFLKKLESAQNGIIRTFLGLSKYNHLSKIKKVLGIDSILNPYLKYKCILI